MKRHCDRGNMHQRYRSGGRVCLLLVAASLFLEPATPTSGEGDPAPATLEDIYGDSGESFQAALGFSAQEGTASNQSVSGFGVAVDDLKVDWREFRLDKDATDCATGGSCAWVNFQSTNVFEGSAVLTITVVDPYPYDPVNDRNDCNGDGDFSDPSDDKDCDDDGTPDVTVLAISDGERAGETVVLDLTAPGAAEYRGSIAVSVVRDAPGVLFLGRTDFHSLTVRARYTDRWDGTSTGGVPNKCRNNADPAKQGIVEASTPIFVPEGRVALVRVRLVDNGDGDGFADTNETVQAYVSFANKSNRALGEITTALSTNDSKIECIARPVVSLGTLGRGETKETPNPFVFKVANVNRSSVTQTFSAEFTVTLRSDEFDALDRSTRFSVDLDLNVGGTCAPATFFEGFEVSSGLGSFTSMSLDGFGTDDHHRCQYHDPGCPHAICNDPACEPGVNSNAYDWHIHQTTAPDGGRAYGGTRSLHWGVHPTGDPKDDTTRFQQLDAIRSTDPINLGLDGPLELSYKQQVSLLDGRCVDTPDGEAADRGTVAVRLADAAGTGFGSWLKLYPYQNVYDAQGTDAFANCTFDPTDDGNNEDSFFDPADPSRRYGPSSTCFPEFVFAAQGDTDHRSRARPDAVGRASDGPGLRGSIDRGTWVESRFDLGQFRGRRIRLRFLATSISVYPAVLASALGFLANETCEDGWYIDDLQVTGACAAPLTVAVDAAPNTGLPGCAACTTVTPSLSADLPSTAAPGQAVLLSAAASSADSCPSGVLQFRYFLDTDASGTFSPSADTLLRDWTDNPIYLDAPMATTRYSVLVRCSSSPVCGQPAVATVTVTVACPSSGTLKSYFGQTLLVSKPSLDGAEPDFAASLSWTTPAAVDTIRGRLDPLRSSAGNFTGTVEACLANNVSTALVSDSAAIAAGSGFYYLVRPVPEFCNETGSWSANAPEEMAGRDSEIGADPNACP